MRGLVLLILLLAMGCPAVAQSGLSRALSDCIRSGSSPPQPTHPSFKPGAGTYFLWICGSPEASLLFSEMRGRSSEEVSGGYVTRRARDGLSCFRGPEQSVGCLVRIYVGGDFLRHLAEGR